MKSSRNINMIMTTTTYAILMIMLMLSVSITFCNAFQIINKHYTHSTSKYNTALYMSDREDDMKPVSRVIRADAEDFLLEPGAGGVGITNESVLKITGPVKHKPGKVNVNLSDFIRYRKIQTSTEQTVQDILNTVNGKIICTGRGVEKYEDPGETTQADITLGPSDAVRDAIFASAGSAMEYDTIIINFAGGDDAQVQEVMDAVQEMVLDLDVKTKASITFNSISHETFPTATSCVTVIGLPDGATTGGKTGIERSISAGEVYFRDGIYYTLSEDDINPAKA